MIRFIPVPPHKDPGRRTNKGPSDRSFSSGDTVWACNSGLTNRGSPSLSATYSVCEHYFRFSFHPHSSVDPLAAWEQGTREDFCHGHSPGLFEGSLALWGVPPAPLSVDCWTSSPSLSFQLIWLCTHELGVIRVATGLSLNSQDFDC